MNRCWINSGTVFRDADADAQIFKGNLPFGVYKPELTRSGYVLNKISDKFVFDYKVYDIDSDFINRVITYWNNSNRNLGILLNGIKGSGKTVTGKLIANIVRLPIILIDDNANELIDYLKTFDFPCVLFFDEYEKVFVKDDSDDPDYSILSLMDGASSDFNRKLFILTTNDLEIDDNLISRPSRIRYCKEYKTLSVEIIRNYINDNLNDKSKAEELCEFINELEDCTIDILKAIIEDMNIFNCSAKEVQSYMNLTKKQYEYSAYYSHNDDLKYTKSEEFLDVCKKVGTINPDTKRIYRRVDFDLVSTRITLDKPFNKLKVGDTVRSDNGYEYIVLEIKDKLLRLIDVDYKENKDDISYSLYYYIRDLDLDNSLYGENAFLI